MIDPSAKDEQTSKVMGYIYQLESEAKQWREKWAVFCDAETSRIRYIERARFTKAAIPSVIVALLIGCLLGYVISHYY